ncbi:MAG: VCBS repeat-containing protein [Gammaproteobacteria bacterium]|nr:VCBS repeat-containing protein [Gammaproteobacteria bacterium]
MRSGAAIRSGRRGNGAVARRCLGRSVALLLVAAVELATAAPRLLDLHGTSSHSAIVRNDDGAWRAYGGDSLAAVVPLAMTAKAQWLFAAAGDFNGDGRDDVLLRRTDGPWAYYPMDGGSVVDTGRGWANMTRSLDWRPVGVGDFNDDGRDDMLLRRADGAWRYYAMDGRRVIAGDSGPANLPQSLDWRIAGVGDFDGDGRGDVLLRHVEGTWQLHPMQGRSVVPGRTANPDFRGTALGASSPSATSTPTAGTTFSSGTPADVGDGRPGQATRSLRTLRRCHATGAGALPPWATSTETAATTCCSGTSTEDGARSRHWAAQRQPQRQECLGISRGGPPRRPCTSRTWPCGPPYRLRWG